MNASYSTWIAPPKDSELVFIAGMTSRDEAGQVIGPRDPTRQAEVIFDRMSAMLEEAGSSTTQLLRLTIFLTDISYLPKVREVRSRYVGDVAPTATAVQVAALLSPEHIVEIDAIAYRFPPKSRAKRARAASSGTLCVP